VDRHARAAKHRIPAHDLAIQPILVGARVERISSARAPEMCPFSKTIRENQTVRETYQGFAESNGSGGISLAVGGVWGSSDDDQRLEAGACAARK
jgi:hypothetical protein